jgi:5'-3' exonuclease
MECAEATFEADDLIGTITTRLRKKGMSATILSRDKDLLQLLREGDVLWDYAADKRRGYHDVPEWFGIKPEQMVDYLALAGDSVDNIPGVRGVGPKTASKLLAHFGSLDNLYDNLDEVASLNIRGASTLGDRLASHRDTAIMSRELTRIYCDAPVDTSKKSITRSPPDLDALNSLYDQAGFGNSLRRQAERIVNDF